MKFRLYRVLLISFVRSFSLVVVSLLMGATLALSQAAAAPQSAAGTLRGVVTDPSGAVIAHASVVLTPAAATSTPIKTQANGQGQYEFSGVPAGQYTLNVIADGFSIYENDSVNVTTSQPLRLNVAMAIEVEQQKIQVSDTVPTIDVNPENNAGAITISGKELDALPDDPDELLTDLQALAGPSAGPNGGQLYIDGFTAGELPPKSSIREIRINQNPFSAEYDKLGYGRIEVFTKPGTDKYHGQFLVDGNDNVFNTTNPFAGTEPGYNSLLFDGNVGGPINKKASFFFTAQRRNINDLSAIDAEALDSGLVPVQILESVPTPHQRTNLSMRFDFAPSKSNTLTARYQYYRDTESNNGIGQTVLPSQAYDTGSTEHTVQISDTQIFGAKVVNETRFQFLREGDGQTAADANPSVNVLGTFSGGGDGQISSDYQNHYELQNYTSVIHGAHTIKFGFRYRDLTEQNTSTQGFNGTFTFSSLCSQQTFPGNTACADIAPGVGMYQYAEQLLQAGATTAPAAQLTITQGSPNANISVYDFEPYVQDDWKMRSNVTLSLGLRYETQNHIRDHVDLAPRVGLAWGLGKRDNGGPQFVIRGGAGIFYDRFQSTQILQAERLNGITQQQIVINNPTCFPGLDKPLTTPIADCGAASTTGSAIYQINPSLYAPYTLQSAISVERQLTKSATLTVTYLNSRGFDQLLSVNSTAPVPGTPCYPNCTTPNVNVYQYVSEGVFRQKQLIVNTNIRAGSKVQLFGYYVLNYANSDVGGLSNGNGASSFASNSYNISQDYGRAAFDIRNRLFVGGSTGLPYGVRLSPFLVASSGSPFNITSPDDLNGDSIFNDRPSFAPAGTACGAPIYCTPLGNFNATPTANQTAIPINYGTGPAHVTMNLRLSKTLSFGPKVKSGTGNLGGGGGPGGGGGGRTGGGGGRGGPLFGGGGPMNLNGNSNRKYNLTLSASARNVFNKVNLGSPGGVLGSSFFDKYNSLQGGPFSQGVAVRRIDLQATFSF